MVDYYEILEVSPKASQEVIKQAYFALAKKYHPDIYPDKGYAVKKMAILNEAYAVLHDPEKRKIYDSQRRNGQYTSQTEHKAERSKNSFYQQADNKRKSFNYAGLSPLQICILRAVDLAKRSGETIQDPKDPVSLHRFCGIGFTFLGRSDEDKFSGSYITRYWFTFLGIPIFPFEEYRVLQPSFGSYIVISSRRSSNLKKLAVCMAGFWLMLIFLFLDYNTKNKYSNPPRTKVTNKAPAKKNAAKPTISHVPKTGIITGYDKGKPVANNQGHSIIEIDNSQNNAPVYVRIWSIDGNPKPVRSFYIKEGEKFSAKNLNPGKYDVRFKFLYKDRDAEYGAKSKTVQLKETQDILNNEIQYSDYSLTLYTVHNGNTHMDQIPADEI